MLFHSAAIPKLSSEPLSVTLPHADVPVLQVPGNDPAL